ncbi:MAG: hypothetical protein Q6353_005095 [Candidatus Sigynarchaeum springense]
MLLAGSIALVMIGGIWFGSTWIPSPWFWLAVGGCAGASIISLITGYIDSAYSGIELEPADLADEDESELKSGAPKPAARPAVATIARKKQPMRVAGVIQKPVARPIPSPAAQAAARQKPEVESKATPVEQKPTTKAVPLFPTAGAAKPAGAKREGESGAKLANQLASISAKEPEMADAEKKEMEAISDEAGTYPVKKVKLNRKNLQLLIQVYIDEGYHAVSFSKFRRDMGVGKGKDALKLKKLMLEAVAMGFLAKKGSKYIIQREGQEPLE